MVALQYVPHLTDFLFFNFSFKTTITTTATTKRVTITTTVEIAATAPPERVDECPRLHRSDGEYKKKTHSLMAVTSCW